MLTTTALFNDTECTVYIGEHEHTYIISIPELAFSMQMDDTLTDKEMADELIMHLFTLFDEQESERASEAILSAVKAE